jgi:hypothetical protein
MNDNEENYEKDDFEREIERIDIKMNMSIKGFFPHILPALIVAVYSLFILSKIPTKGIPAKFLFKINILTPMEIILMVILLYIFNKISMGRKNILMVFIVAMAGFISLIYFQSNTYVISYDMFQWILLPIAGISILMILYYIIYAKTAVITANKRFVQISKGVFTRINDSTNLTKLQDEDLERNTMDIVLGLGKVILELGRNQKIIFDKISIHNAEKLHKFVKANSFGQSREYWLTKDRINNRVNPNKGGRPNGQYISDDGDGGDFDGSDGV